MRVVGLDVGGANVKAADSDGMSECRPFAIWTARERLPEILADVLSPFAPVDLVALTMTAELADCFQTKAEGVDFILNAVAEAANGVPVVVWQTGAEFVTPVDARDVPLLVSAANWHALATFVGRMVPTGDSLLIDIGTTTTDIIRLTGGIPVPEGLTDRERLESGELVYTGIWRTPVCAVARAVPLRRGNCPLAAELFATMLDAYLLLGEIAEGPANCSTANGRPATCEWAHDRLARAVCCDRTELDRNEATAVARYLAAVQQSQINDAVQRVLERFCHPCGTVLLSGAGTFLGRRIIEQNDGLREAETIELARLFGDSVSEAACAFAVARLALERV